MSGVAALALRLAVRSDPAGRRRSLMVAGATAAGTAATLAILAFTRADRVLYPERYADGGMGRLVAAVIAVVGLQVATLAATAGRLSAVVRARRLANLRLLGLTAARTRLVSAIEVGIFAAAGAFVGVGLFVASRPLLAMANVDGQRWPERELHPGVVTGALVAVVNVLLTVGLAVLPDRLNHAAAVARVRRASRDSPTLWRVVPLAAGIALCVYVQQSASAVLPAPPFLAGVVALGIGIMLVVPVFVGLVAAMLERVARGPVLLVAARRLQAQPAAMSRVISGLLIGLFVATGAMSIVTAFESTPQYEGASIAVQDHQSVTVGSVSAGLADTVRSIAMVPGVRSVTPLAELTATGCDPDAACPTAVVATCRQFETVYPSARGCVPGDVQSIRQSARISDPVGRDALWSSHTGATARPVVVTGRVRSTIEIASLEPFSRDLDVRIPPTLPGVAEITAASRYTVYVVGEPGRDLPDRLRAAGFVGAIAPWDPADHDGVAALRVLSFAVAGVVLGLGLIAFAISTIDRAVGRRREVAGLILLGTPGSLLRRTQWLEAAIPVVGGGVLAVVLGLLAGSAYLAGVGDIQPPVNTAAWLAASAAIGGFIVAGLGVLAASPTIDTLDIRRE